MISETIRQFVLWYSNCHPCKRNADQRIAHDAELRAIITKYGHEHNGGTIDVETAEAMFIAQLKKLTDELLFAANAISMDIGYRPE